MLNDQLATAKVIKKYWNHFDSSQEKGISMSGVLYLILQLLSSP